MHLASLSVCCAVLILVLSVVEAQEHYKHRSHELRDSEKDFNMKRAVSPPRRRAAKSRGDLYNCAEYNPCDKDSFDAKDKKTYYFRHVDIHKYIQCSSQGKCFEHSVDPNIGTGDDIVTWK